MKIIIDESVFVALLNALRRGQFPLLSHISFEGCGSSVKGKLPMLFESTCLELADLNLKGCHLDETDMRTIVDRCHENDNENLPNLASLDLDFSDKTDQQGKTIFHNKEHRFHYKIVRNIHKLLPEIFTSTLTSLTRLHLHSVNKEEYILLMDKLNDGLAPNISDLGVTMWKHVDVHKTVQNVTTARSTERGNYCVVFEAYGFIERLPSIVIPTLTCLKLHNFIRTEEHLSILSGSTALPKLHKLDIYHSSGITGNLSVLLRRSFPSLNSLISSDCGLNSQDLCSLAQVNVEGRLPQLRHLDISHNIELVGHLRYLFERNCKWEGLHSLNIESTCALSHNDCQQLASKVTLGSLSALRILRIFVQTEDIFLNRITAPLKHLQRLELMVDSAQSTGKILESVSLAVERRLLLALDTVVFNMKTIPISMPQFYSKMKEFNVLIVAMIGSIVASIDPFHSPDISDMKQNPTLATELVAALDPPVADRISGIFPDADPEMLESVTSEFTEKLVEILPELFKDAKGSASFTVDSSSQDKMKFTLTPLLAGKIAAVVGLPLTDQFIYWFHSLWSDAYVGPEHTAQMLASSYPFDVKYKLRKRGIRIYYVHQPDSEFRSDKEGRHGQGHLAKIGNNSPDPSGGASEVDPDPQELWHPADDVIQTTFISLRQKLFTQGQLEFSQVVAFLYSAYDAVCQVLSKDFPDLDDSSQEELSHRFITYLAHRLSSGTGTGEAAWSLYRLVHTYLNAPNSKNVGISKLLDFVQDMEIVVKQNLQSLTSLNPPVADTISSFFPDADPDALESVTRKFTGRLDQIVSSLMKGYESDASLKRKLLGPLLPLVAARYETLKKLNNCDDISHLETIRSEEDTTRSVDREKRDESGLLGQNVQNQPPSDPSLTTEIVASIDPPIIERISSAFPRLDSAVLLTVMEIIQQSIVTCLSSDTEQGNNIDTNLKGRSESELECDTLAAYVMSEVDEHSATVMGNGRLLSVIESILKSVKQ